MSVLVTVLITLLMFGIIIAVHESGHLICAKACGIYVEEFSIGMGPLLFSFKKGDTEYSLRLLPIGGYCKMPGEDGDSEYENGFDKKSVWKRMIVVLGGALFNIIFAVLVFIIAYVGIGTPSDDSVVGDVNKGYPAYQCLESGDEIIAIDGVSVDTWSEMTEIIQSSQGEELTLTIIRDNQEQDVTITPVEEDDRYILGITAQREPISIFAAVKQGFVKTYEITKLIIVSLWQMITGAIGVDLSGPVGVGQMVGQVVEYGFLNFLLFMAIISVNLGVVNLLPLPALDGSRFCFLLIEAIRRKPISHEIEGRIHFIGFVLLMVLFVVITYSDIMRIAG